MMRTRWMAAGALAALAAVGACSSSSSGGGGVLPGGDGGASCLPDCFPGKDGGLLDGASPMRDGATPGDGGATDGAPPAVDAGDPMCDPGAAWAIVARDPSIAAAGFDRFGSVSGDELTVAWATSAGAIYVADRAKIGDAFGAAVQVDLGGATAAAGDRVALGPGGDAIVFVAADRRSMVEYDRSSRTSAWQKSPLGRLAAVNGMNGPEGQMGLFSEPVLGGDKASLYFMFTQGTAAPRLLESRFQGAAWLPGDAFPNAELQSTDATHRRRPTGMSADGRTLFFFDETTGLERGAWRDSPASPFGLFVDLTNVPEASPNRFCSTLYFRGSDGLYTAR